MVLRNVDLTFFLKPEIKQSISSQCSFLDKTSFQMAGPSDETGMSEEAPNAPSLLWVASTTHSHHCPKPHLFALG